MFTCYNNVGERCVYVNGQRTCSCLQSVLHLHNLTGERLMTFPLDIGSIVGYSGRKKDSEVGKLRENLEHLCLVYCRLGLLTLPKLSPERSP